MTIDNELIDNLLKDYKKPEDIIGENGLLKQLTKQLLERAMAAELTDQVECQTTTVQTNTPQTRMPAPLCSAAAMVPPASSAPAAPARKKATQERRMRKT